MSKTPNQIIEILTPYVSEHRQELMKRVVDERTRHISLVFEDINKPHNINAVVRTAECFGVQDLHFIKNKNDYQVSKGISQGSTKWLSFHHHNEKQDNVTSCYNQLRENGYKILATSLHEKSKSIFDSSPEEKIAVVFGTEGTGISEQAGNQADGYVHVPMVGFTESFNLSVTAAIILTHFFKDKNASWLLSDQEKEELIAEWYQRSVRASDKILEASTS